jgi:hypothetical protein
MSYRLLKFLSLLVQFWDQERMLFVSWTKSDVKFDCPKTSYRKFCVSIMKKVKGWFWMQASFLNYWRGHRAGDVSEGEAAQARLRQTSRILHSGRHKCQGYSPGTVPITQLIMAIGKLIF